MITPKVSFIVPVYNTRDYVISCLESIAAQTFPDYEVIIMNDGSTDDSAELITQFIQEKSLPNFILITKENGGISSARNAALSHAKGEWITFVDSDDWIGPNYLADMIHAVDCSDCDLCLAQFRAYSTETGSYDVWSNYPLNRGSIPGEMYGLSSFDFVWGRMYRRSIIEKYGLVFDSRIHYCEDNAFNYDYISHIRHYVCVEGDFYTYRREREGALSQSIVYPRMRYYVFEHMQNFCSRFDFNDLVETLHKNISFSRITWNAVTTAVVVDILENNYKSARKKIDTPLFRAIVDIYVPTSKKASALRFLWKYSFPGLVVLVKVYYGNFEFLKKCKRLFRFISH